MSYPVIENPVTGERGIVRRAPASTVVRGTLGRSRGQGMQRPAGEYWDHREARMTRWPVTRTEPGT